MEQKAHNGMTETFTEDHPVKVTRVVKPEKSIITKNGNKVVYWFDWTYGCLTFRRMTMWEKKDGTFSFMKYSRGGRSTFAVYAHYQAPDWFWKQLCIKLAETNPLGLSVVEFLEKVLMGKRRKNGKKRKSPNVTEDFLIQKSKEEESEPVRNNSII